MRRVTTLVALGALLLTAAWWLLLISPRNSRIADLEDQQFAAVDTEQRLRTQIRQLQEIQDREVEYIAAVGRLDALIPDQPLLEEFIDQIYALAGDTGIDLQTLAPSVPAGAEGTALREISVSVQVEGEFFELLGFLFGLSDMERLVRVDGISLATSVQDDGSTALSASLELTLFTLADLLPTASTDGSTDGSTSTTSPGPSAGSGER